MAKDIKVGIVGLGRGDYFAGIFQANPHTTVTAVCDVNEELTREVAERHGVDQVYTCFEGMVEKAGIDAVFIGTPMHVHVPQSIMALERNISVLCEVPAAVSLDECTQLVKAWKKSRGFYMMAENCCYMRSNMLVREIASAGLFGELYFGEGEYIHECKSLNEVTRWRRVWQTGVNGNTYPTHSLGPVYQWFGQQRVTSVCCYGTGHHYKDSERDHYENEDSTFTACKLSGGGLVNLRLDMLSNRPHNLSYYSLQGTQGCYEAARGFGDKPKIWLADRHNENTWHDLDDFAEEFLPDVWRNPSKELQDAGHGGGDYLEAVDFVSSLVEGKEPMISMHEAMDMTIPGLVSQLSIEEESTWLGVPDSRRW